MTTITFTTIYRTGGTENCVWKRCLAVQSEQVAREQAASIEKMGYRAIVHRTHILDAIGMPEGWRPERRAATQRATETDMQLTQRDIERNRQTDSACEQVAEVRRELARLGAAQHARRAKLLRRLAELRAAQDALARL